jgi:hypothetical protein
MCCRLQLQLDNVLPAAHPLQYLELKIFQVAQKSKAEALPAEFVFDKIYTSLHFPAELAKKKWNACEYFTQD